MSDIPASQPRTYGNFRRPKSAGIGKLGTLGTAVLFVGLIGEVVLLAIHLLWAVIGALALVVVVIPLALPDRHGRTLFQGFCSRVAWRWGRARGRHLYRAGPLSTLPGGRWSLPGLAASILVVEATDATGRPFALLHHARANAVSVVLDTSPEGAALVDAAIADGRVAAWGEFLAGLANEPSLIAAAVINDSSPDPGTRLRAEVDARLSPQASPLALTVLEEIKEHYSLSSAITTTRLTLTWSCAMPGLAGRRRSVDVMAEEIARRLPALALALTETGAGVARPLSRSELVGAMRLAFNPDLQMHADAGVFNDVAWEDAGPGATDERVDTYGHEAWTSVSWAATQAPRGAVQSNVLDGLIAAHPAIARKRVAILYRPYTPTSAVRVIDRDTRISMFGVNNDKIPKGRTLKALTAAQKTSDEEANGAGLTRFAIMVTATVPAGDRDALARAEAAVDALGVTSRLVLRRCSRWQSSAFLATLPLGLVLPQALRVPSELKEAL